MNKAVNTSFKISCCFFILKYTCNTQIHAEIYFLINCLKRPNPSRNSVKRKSAVVRERRCVQLSAVALLWFHSHGQPQHHITTRALPCCRTGERIGRKKARKLLS